MEQQIETSKQGWLRWGGCLTIYHKLCKISESWGWNTQRGRKPFDDAKQREKLEQCGLEERVANVVDLNKGGEDLVCF